MRIQRARAKIWLGRSLRQVVAAALLSVGVLFCLPGILIRGDPLYQGSEVVESLPPSGDAASGGVQAASRDRGRAVRLQMDDGTIRELSMSDYLWGVVAAEMPASFELEALKAQACAARTYTVIRQNSGSDKHPGADICEDSTCCQAYIEREAALARWGLNAQEYEEKISQAVEGTDGLGILYEGQPIQALFFSSAAGRTVDAVAVWGNSVDYLKSVDSPEGDEVPNYHSQVVLSSQQVQEAALAAYPGADLSGEPSSWFGQAVRDEGGTVTSIPFGGLTLTGGQVRSMLSLRSAAFTVTWDGENFTFDVTGYGHGVGMSQYGANARASFGAKYDAILTYYYIGAQLKTLSPS